MRAVVTDQGRIACDKLVICAGQWSRALGRMAGVNIPLVPVQHQYLITEPIAGVASNLPTLRDPDRLTYWKEEVGGLVMGGYEHNPKPWAIDGLPDGFEFQLLDTDLDHFEPLLELAAGRVPAMQTAGIREFINGPESFTPDGNFILGEAPETRGVFVGAGFNAFGIAAGGGAGMVLAEWVAKGEPPYDLWPVDIRRFGRNHLDTNWVRTRTLEAYAKHYAMAWPHEEYRSGRPLRRSPLYDRLKAQGACFGEKLGFERPNWFADLARGEKAEDVYTYERPNWFDAVGREHKAARERVALFDQTSFAKFLLTGPDAEKALSWIAANDVAKPPGHLVYTQMLNARGGIECDLTVARLAQDEYYIVTGTGFATHDFDWIARSIPEGLDARLIDVTSSYAVLSVMGPKSRDLLQSLSENDLSNAAFPFGRVQRITVAGAPVLALRVTYVGELGWELHIPVEFAASLYEVADGGGTEARHRQCRIPRHRFTPAREGIPGLGRRYRSRPLAARGRSWLGGEAKRGHPIPRTRRARISAQQAAAAAPCRVHRRSFGSLARARDDLSRRQARRLADKRRLRTYDRPRHRLRLCPRCRERRDARRIAFRQLSARSRHGPRPRQDLFRAALRSGDVTHQELNRALVSARRRHCSHKSNRSAKSRDC